MRKVDELQDKAEYDRGVAVKDVVSIAKRAELGAQP